MIEGKIVLECIRYQVLRKKEVSREKMLKDFCSIREILSYENSKVLDNIINAIENATEIRWYENYNFGSSYAIEWKDNEKKENIVAISGADRLTLSLFEKYFRPEIKYNYKINEKEIITNILKLDDVYELFSGVAKVFKDDNKYSTAILDALPTTYEITFEQSKLLLTCKQDNIKVSFEIAEENTIILSILKKLAL